MNERECVRVCVCACMNFFNFLVGYGEKKIVSSDDKWNKNALNYDPNQKVDKKHTSNKLKNQTKDKWNKNANEYGNKDAKTNNDGWNKNAMNYKK